MQARFAAERSARITSFSSWAGKADFSPNPFKNGLFRQELILRDGYVKITEKTRILRQRRRSGLTLFAR
ncbi:MAG: hypothetical protein LBJ57_02215 [Prevotellaceae bacterium]|jgi:hypothetical protein|nr:hypothetical protein [Prevotellaceae bacterium]